MTPNIITNISAAATLLFAIVGGAWLNAYLLRRLLAQQNKPTDAKLAALNAKMDAGFAAVRADSGILRAEVQKDIGILRAEQNHSVEQVQRIERQLESIFKPVLPK